VNNSSGRHSDFRGGVSGEQVTVRGELVKMSPDRFVESSPGNKRAAQPCEHRVRAAPRLRSGRPNHGTQRLWPLRRVTSESTLMAGRGVDAAGFCPSGRSEGRRFAPQGFPDAQARIDLGSGLPIGATSPRWRHAPW
jgi:hypothetical protein